MYRIKVIVLLFAISNLFSSTEDDYEIISVVSKIPQSAKTVVSSVDKIDKIFFENSQSKDLTSLLRENLALDTSSNGGIGQLSSVFLRGTNSNHMLVKVNGVKINPSTAGGASIYNLDTELINSLEIGYGPLSSVHGSAAIGGVMNISTKPIEIESNYKIGIQVGQIIIKRNFSPLIMVFQKRSSQVYLEQELKPMAFQCSQIHNSIELMIITQ